MTTHEDDRRKLTSFPEGKMLEIKEDCVVGGHYHKIKTELFILSEGEGEVIMNRIPEQMIIGVLYIVPPNSYHEFHIKKGSVLIGLCTHPFDPSDDYKL